MQKQLKQNTDRQIINEKLQVPQQGERLLCKSAEYQRNFDSQTKIDILQVNELKEKAHKSFLQVIQMENLHQQQIELLRQQFEQRERSAKQKEEQLQTKIMNLETEVRLFNRYNLDVSNSSFTLDNIDMICSRDLNEQLRADDSTITILQIKQLIQSKQLSKEEKLKNFRKQIVKELSGFEIGPEEKRKMDQFIEKIYKAMRQIQQDNFTLTQKSQELERKYQLLETQYKSLKIQYESSQKQARFLSEHIKRLSSQKFNIDKKLVEVSKHKRVLQQTVKYLKQNLNQKGELVKEQLPFLNINDDNKSCVNMQMDRSQISNSRSQDWMLDELNSSKQSVKTLKTSLFLKHAQSPNLNKQGQSKHPHINNIKNFRKKKQTNSKFQPISTRNMQHN